MKTPQRPVHIEQEVINLYDEYTHRPLPRRVFLQRLTAIVGSSAAAYTLLPLLENNYAQAAVVAADDLRVSASMVSYPDSGETWNGYMAIPSKADDRLPAVIVIHENRGLNPHIQDVTRRVALAGYLALAPDYLSRQGGTPADEDKAREMFDKLDAKSALNTSLDTLKYLKNHPRCTGKVGVVGFCWGGGQANQLAVHAPDLNASVAFYGMQPKAEEVAKIKAPLLLHYAGLDERINAGIAPFEKELKAAKKRYTVYLYDGVNHAFNNDTNAARYNEAAAKLSWQRTLDFFAENLV